MRFFLPLVLLLLAASLSAQSRAGSMYLNGSANLTVIEPIANEFDRPPFHRLSARGGVFLTDRLLLGTSLSVVRSTFGAEDYSAILRPFARLYFAPSERKVQHFAELSFGTIGLFGTDWFETDFIVGGGVESEFKPGILGTARLRYNANASGLNFTTLSLGFNVLLGRLAEAELTSPVAAGTLVSDANVVSVSYGRMSSGGDTDQLFNASLSPTVGYFVIDGLLIEGRLGIAANSSSNEIGSQSSNFNSTSIGGGLGLRYYPLQSGRVLPFVTAGYSGTQQTFRTTQFGRETEQTFSQNSLELGVGASCFLSPHLALEGSLGYRRMAFNFDFQGQAPDPIANKDLQLDVGFRFYLPAQ